MKKLFALFLAVAMALTIMACGKKPEDTAKDRIGTAETGMEFYVATSEDGSKTVVDKSGAAAEGFSLDEGGNIVDKDGRVIVAADKVQQLPTVETKPNESSEPSSGSGDSSSVPSGTGTGSEAKSNTGSAGGGSSDGKKPSGSGSSSGNSGSSSGSSSGNSGSSSGSTPTVPTPTPVHQHSWEPVYRTEIVDDYEMASVWRCNGCNADVTAILESGESMKQHFHETGNPNCMGYHSSYEQVKVGSHEEHILDHYACSCGATKAP